MCTTAHIARRWRFKANLQEWNLCSPCVLWVSTEPRLSGVAAVILTSGGVSVALFCLTEEVTKLK